MRIIEEEQLDFDDVSIQPKRSSLNSRSEVNLFRDFKWTTPNGNNHVLTCKTLCVANMGTVGTPKMASYATKKGYLCAMEKHYSFDELNKLYTELENDAINSDLDKNTYTDRIALSIGVKESTDVIEEMSKIHKINVINVDIPNGYIPRLMDRVDDIRKILPDAFIIAGTVVTSDIVTDLIMHSVNAVRCGICLGSACVTALKTGVRRPAVSMLMDCADAAHQLNGYIMLDGGIRTPSDWCKALIAGADICMSGSIFAGTDLAEGDIIEKRYATNELSENGERKIETKKFKIYYGMSSNYAQEKHFGGIKSYRTSEGREKLIEYNGSIDDVLKDYEGGLASMMCYIGAKSVKHIQRQGTLYKVRHQINDKFSHCEDI